jgi:hypothetical protein
MLSLRATGWDERLGCLGDLWKKPTKEFQSGAQKVPLEAREVAGGAATS